MWLSPSKIYLHKDDCHETYKDENGNWLYPDEIEKDEKIILLRKMISQRS